MMIKRNIVAQLIVVFLLGILLSGCDPERKRKCEWTLMPEPEDRDKQDPGYFAVCARNFVNMRQQCDLQIKEETAKLVYQKYFKLTDMKLEEGGRFPRKILSIELCEQD